MLPTIPQELPDPFVQGPMAAEGERQQSALFFKALRRMPGGVAAAVDALDEVAAAEVACAAFAWQPSGSRRCCR